MAAYLNSYYAKQLVLQKQTGGISEGINHPELMEIEIPILSQQDMNKIASDYRKANANLKQARDNINAIPNKIAEMIK